MKKKHYKIKITKKLLKQLFPFWDRLELSENFFRKRLDDIEKDMAKETGIKDIEFFWCDNEIVGIGNTSRTMPLIQMPLIQRRLK